MKYATDSLNSAGVVHGGVREAIGVRVVRPPDVLEGDPADLVGHEACLGVQWLQPGVLHFVDTLHLLHEQERVGPHVHGVVMRQ